MGKAKTPSNKHMELLGQTIPHQTVGSLSGGKCIAKHEVPYNPNCSCSHRWQAFEKAMEHSDMYNLSDADLRAGSARPMLFRGGAAAVAKLAQQGVSAVLSAGNKGMYLRKVDKPRVGDWDIDRSKYNFKWDCNKPYYHEAHHVVPDATLRAALTEVFKKSAELAFQVMCEVLDAPYNVHGKVNMIILPMDERVGKMLQLPIHRETKKCNHSAYDVYIKEKLKARFRAALREIMKKHDEEGGTPQYKSLAEAIDVISAETYVEVSTARGIHGVKSIEELGKKLMQSLASNA